jgi:hypothetical protein
MMRAMVLLAFFTSTVLGGPTKLCPAGWIMGTDKCYYVDTGSYDYSTCSALCTAKSARMLCIENQERLEFASTLAIPTKDVWVSLNDFAVDGTFVWGPGCPSTYYPWQSGEPTNGAGENCCVIWADRKRIADGNCNVANYNCVCETDLTASLPSCPVGWVVGLNGECYYFEDVASPYTQCPAKCAAMGASPLCIQNAAQNAFIWGVRPGQSTWIGLSQQTTGFSWPTGCTSTFLHWQTNEPNNGNGPVYVAMHDFYNGFWVDVADSQPNTNCACQYTYWEPMTSGSQTLTSQHVPTTSDASVGLNVTASTLSSADKVLVLFNGNWGELSSGGTPSKITLQRNGVTQAAVFAQGASGDAQAVPMVFLDSPSVAADSVYSVLARGTGSLNPTYGTADTLRHLSAVVLPSYINSAVGTVTTPFNATAENGWYTASAGAVLAKQQPTDWTILMYTGRFQSLGAGSGVATIQRTATSVLDTGVFLQKFQTSAGQQSVLSMFYAYQPVDTAAASYRASVLMESGTAIFPGGAAARQLVALSLPNDQVFSKTLTDRVLTKSGAFSPISQFSVSVKPRRITDKIVLLLNMHVGTDNPAGVISVTIYRNTVNLGGTYGLQRVRTGGNSTANLVFVDAPQSANAQVYAVYWRTSPSTTAFTSAGVQQLTAFVVGEGYFNPTSQPSRQPSSQPSAQPSCQPQRPTIRPSIAPSAIPTIAPSVVPASSCPAGFFVYANKCYYMSSTIMSYAACTTTCTDKAAKLLCVENDDQNTFIANNYPSIYETSFQGIFIGYGDSVTEGTFKWDASCPSTFAKWDNGEPENGQGSNEDCSILQRSNKKWIDISCDTFQGTCGCETGLTVSTSICPVGWVVSSTGGCIYLMNTQTTWAQCQSSCAAMSSTMMCIQDKPQRDFIWDLRNGRKTWIGYRQQSGLWGWVTGCSSSYTSWAANMPALGSGSYVAFMDAATGGWTDAVSSATATCACQTQPTWKPLDTTGYGASSALTITSASYDFTNMDAEIATTTPSDKVLFTASFSWRSDGGAPAFFTIRRNSVTVGGTDFRVVNGPAGRTVPVSLSYLYTPPAFGANLYTILAKGSGVIGYVGTKRQVTATRIPSYLSSAMHSSVTTLTVTDSSQYTDMDLTVAVTTTSIRDKVLLMLNVEILQTALGTASTTIFRGALDLGHGRGLCVVRDGGAGTVRSSGNIAYLDRPGTVGTVVYSARARAGSATSNVQFPETQQLAAIVFKADESNSTELNSPFQVTSSSWVNLGLSVGMWSGAAADEMFVTAHVPVQANGDDCDVLLSIFRYSTDLGGAGDTGMQRVVPLHAGYTQTVVITFVDAPAHPGSVVIYTVYASQQHLKAGFRHNHDS